MEPTLSTAFTIWASVVALTGAAIVYQLLQMRGDIKEMSHNLTKHILHTERRQTHVETFLQIKHDDYTPLPRAD